MPAVKGVVQDDAYAKMYLHSVTQISRVLQAQDDQTFAVWRVVAPGNHRHFRARGHRWITLQRWHQ